MARASGRCSAGTQRDQWSPGCCAHKRALPSFAARLLCRPARACRCSVATESGSAEAPHLSGEHAC
eukprot:scaffold905_cov70-Phaeocystis_antarctica.AAC.2